MRIRNALVFRVETPSVATADLDADISEVTVGVQAIPRTTALMPEKPEIGVQYGADCVVSWAVPAIEPGMWLVGLKNTRVKTIKRHKVFVEGRPKVGEWIKVALL